MSITVSTWVWDHSRSRHAARLVLLAIADCARDDGTAWPSNPELRRKTELGERAVQTAVTALVKLGELEVGYQQGPKGCNRYRVLMTPAESAPPQTLRGAKSAPPQNLRPSESSQDNSQDPAESAPPAKFAPPQNPASDPANFAPGTVRDPSQNSPTESSSSAPKRDRNEGREDVDRLCTHLADRIEGNGNLRPKITKGWRDAARLMLDSDGRTEKQAHLAIDWCQGNGFWRKNILSMPTLREKYDRLRMEAEDEREQKRDQDRAGRRPSTTNAATEQAMQAGRNVGAMLAAERRPHVA